MSLIELVISITMVSLLCIAITGISIAPIQDKLTAITCLEICAAARLQAMATGQDLSLTPSNFSTAIPPTPLSINVPALGFKSTGHTKTAGTLTVGKHPYKITVAVGFGRPQLKN